MSLKYIKGAWVFVVLLGFGQGYAQEGVVVDQVIAKVDDFIVLKSELDRAYLEFVSRGQITQGDTKCRIFEQLVINKMLVAKAEIDSVYVLDPEVNANLDRRMAHIIQQFGTQERLEEIYNKTIDEFKAELFEQVKEQMLTAKMRQEIVKDIKVTPAEVKRYFNNIPLDSLPYFSTEVTIGQIVKKPQLNEATKRQIRQRLRDIRDSIKAGADFATLAKKYSMDPGSAAAGGELGFFKRGELAPAFEAAAFAMKPGEISKPIETQFGIHLIQLIERRGNSYNTRHILIIPKPTERDIEQTKNYLDSLKNLVLLDSAKFETLAKEYSDDTRTSGNGGYLSDETGAMRISVENLNPTLFFTIDTLAIGSITAPMKFTMEDGSDALRIVRYKDKIPPHQASLRQDYQKIKAATLNSKQNTTITQWFKDTQKQVYINIAPEYKACDILAN